MHDLQPVIVECSIPWPTTFISFLLMIMPKSGQAHEKLSMRLCSCCSVWETMAASSVKSMSLMTVLHIFVFAFSREVEQSPIQSGVEIDTFCG